MVKNIIKYIFIYTMCMITIGCESNPMTSQQEFCDYCHLELEERFTIGDFKRLEADNRHDIAAKKLVDKFGTPEDKKEIDAINKRHNKTGYITGPDFKKRTQIVNKYFSKLMP